MIKKHKILLIISVLTIGCTYAQGNAPFVNGNAERELLIRNRQWQLVPELSDEFNRANSQNVGPNWTDVPVSNGFSWIGREPVRFQADNARIQGNQLWISGARYTGNAGARDDNNTRKFTHSGAIVRSRANATPGVYMEARMRSANTFMSGTFWMSSRGQNCNINFTELDVTESIGRSTGRFRPLTRPDDPNSNPGWWAPTRTNFLAGMNANVRRRGRSNPNCPQTAQNTPRQAGNFQPEAGMHVYGVYWENANRIHFYLDGRYVNSVINPPIAMNAPMAINMAIEGYDFNWPSYNNVTDGMNLGLWGRSTKYDWVRTWRIRPGGKEIAISEKSDTISIHPNPAKDIVKISGLKGVEFVTIRNMRGQEVFSVSTDGSINVSSLKAGVYILDVTGVKTIKLIKE